MACPEGRRVLLPSASGCGYTTAGYAVRLPLIGPVWVVTMAVCGFWGCAHWTIKGRSRPQAVRAESREEAQ